MRSVARRRLARASSFTAWACIGSFDRGDAASVVTSFSVVVCASFAIQGATSSAAGIAPSGTAVPKKGGDDDEPRFLFVTRKKAPAGTRKPPAPAGRTRRYSPPEYGPVRQARRRLAVGRNRRGLVGGFDNFGRSPGASSSTCSPVRWPMTTPMNRQIASEPTSSAPVGHNSNRHPTPRRDALPQVNILASQFSPLTATATCEIRGAKLPKFGAPQLGLGRGTSIAKGSSNRTSLVVVVPYQIREPDDIRRECARKLRAVQVSAHF